MELDSHTLQLFDQMPVPALILTKERKIKEGNAAFHKSFRKTTDGVKNKKFDEVTLRTAKKSVPRKLSSLVTTESYFDNFSIVYLRKPITSLPSQKNKEHYLRVMAEHIPRSTFILFEEDNRISIAKGRPLETFGCNREKLEGKRLDEILRPGKLAEFEEIMHNARKGQERILVRTVEESTYRIEFIPVMNDSGEVVSVLFISEDITLQRKADIEKSRVEKLELTQKILRNIAHEVRNPLTNINLSVDELREITDNNPEAEDFLSIISRNTSRINELVSKIMKSTRPASVKKKKIKVDKLLKGVDREVSDRIKLRDIEFKIRNSYQELTISVDSEKFISSLANLVINAVEAIDEDQEGKVSLAVWENEGELIFSVKDNGKGMTQEELHKIYDPFQTGKSKGMGLGLTGVMNIVKAHNGDISVQSKPDEGTEFYIKLPLNDEMH